LRCRPGHFDEVGDRRAAAARGRRLVLTDSHESCPSLTKDRLERSTEDVDRSVLEGDDGTLGVLALPPTGAGAAALALTVQGVDLGDLHIEDRFNGLLDLGLVRVLIDEEGVLPLVHQAVRLLRDDRRDDDVARVLEVETHDASSDLRLPLRNDCRAASVNTMSSATSTSYVLSCSSVSTWTRGRLRTRR